MIIDVIAHPNAKKERIESDLFGNLHVYVNQPPLEGKANSVITKSLAQHFGVKKSDVILLSGERYKKKKFEIIGTESKT